MNKVVFIGLKEPYCRDSEYSGAFPLARNIYTPNMIKAFEGVDCYELKEIPKVFWPCELFRPVQDIGDSVETHIKELIKKEDLQTISV